MLQRAHLDSMEALARQDSEHDHGVKGGQVADGGVYRRGVWHACMCRYGKTAEHGGMGACAWVRTQRGTEERGQHNQSVVACVRVLGCLTPFHDSKGTWTNSSCSFRAAPRHRASLHERVQHLAQQLVSTGRMLSHKCTHAHTCMHMQKTDAHTHTHTRTHVPSSRGYSSKLPPSSAVHGCSGSVR